MRHGARRVVGRTSDAHHVMMHPFSLVLDGSKQTSLVEQIRAGITSAIHAGVLRPGCRLPSWRALASQLGVSRGTVRSAYGRLQDAQLIVTAGAMGTRVSDRPAVVTAPSSPGPIEEPLPEMYADFSPGPGVFQMGIPALDGFPSALFTRIRTRVARSEFTALRGHSDPRGEATLRREIAAHLALSRSIECLPSQVIVTSGYSGALGLALYALRLGAGHGAWVEEPGYPLTRRALEMAGLATVPVPVDEEGLNVDAGMRRAPDAAVAVVTPGQQAPLGATLSLARRLKLLEWAKGAGGWIIEDDYLGELQLHGRAAPALASLDREGRVIHVGSFSKTLSPTLRLGFVVVPPALAASFGNAAACLAPAPGPAVQLATALFMREGHYLRHLRRMKRMYMQRGEVLKERMERFGIPLRPAGLGMLLELEPGVADTRLVRDASAFGLTPSPLSPWYGDPKHRKSGLLLGVTTVPGAGLDASCERLHRLIRAATSDAPGS